MPLPAAEAARRPRRNAGDTSSVTNAPGRVDKKTVDQNTSAIDARKQQGIQQRATESSTYQQDGNARELDNQHQPPSTELSTSQSQDLLDLQSDPNQLASLVARFNASVASGFQSTIDNSTQNEGLVKEGRQSRYAAEAIAEYNANQHVEERNHFTTVLGIDVYA